MYRNYWVALVVAGMSSVACMAEPEPDGAASEARTGERQEALQKADTAAKPVDATPVTSGETASVAAKANLQKAPPLRKATKDEIEVLNETFGTEGSREIILRRIENAKGEDDRQRLVGYYNSVVLRNLSAADREAARGKLESTLARAQ